MIIYTRRAAVGGRYRFYRVWQLVATNCFVIVLPATAGTQPTNCFVIMLPATAVTQLGKRVASHCNPVPRHCGVKLTPLPRLPPLPLPRLLLLALLVMMCSVGILQARFECFFAAPFWAFHVHTHREVIPVFH